MTTDVLWRLGLGLAAAALAKSRGRDPFFWGLLTAILYFPIVLLIFLPPVSQRGGRANPSRSASTEDPFDGQTVEVKPMSKEDEHESSGVSSFSAVQWYLLDKERKSLGPFPFLDMQQKFWDGELNEETFVWTPAWKEWKKVGSIPGLLSSLSQ